MLHLMKNAVVSFSPCYAEEDECFGYRFVSSQAYIIILCSPVWVLLDEESKKLMDIGKTTQLKFLLSRLKVS